jgi:ABC-type lipoprotein release transport system permease subunit
MIGIYGVTAYAATQRRHEIGICLAFGAQRGDVIGLLLRQGMKLAGVRIVIGAPPLQACRLVSSP